MWKYQLAMGWEENENKRRKGAASRPPLRRPLPLPETGVCMCARARPPTWGIAHICPYMCHVYETWQLRPSVAPNRSFGNVDERYRRLKRAPTFQYGVRRGGLSRGRRGMGDDRPSGAGDRRGPPASPQGHPPAALADGHAARTRGGGGGGGSMPCSSRGIPAPCRLRSAVGAGQ